LPFVSGEGETEGHEAQEALVIGPAQWVRVSLLERRRKSSPIVLHSRHFAAANWFSDLFGFSDEQTSFEEARPRARASK
jgi:hypothetical protein